MALQGRPEGSSDNKTAKIVVRPSSRLSELKRMNGVRTNVFSHQRKSAGDTFFQTVPETMGKRIFWGSEVPEDASE